MFPRLPRPLPVYFITMLLCLEANGSPANPLGDLEKQALELALTQVNGKLATTPKGKTIRSLRVVTLPVFVPTDGRFLGWFNRFHRTTRNNILRREILLHPGQVWNQEKIAETQRRLRDPALSNLVVIAPLETPIPDQVDLLLVTRDVWSLRLNSSFEIQSRRFSKLEFSLSENNFLGWRKTIGDGV